MARLRMHPEAKEETAHLLGLIADGTYYLRPFKEHADFSVIRCSDSHEGAYNLYRSGILTWGGNWAAGRMRIGKRNMRRLMAAASEAKKE